jgi:hypothetical protein
MNTPPNNSSGSGVLCGSLSCVFAAIAWIVVLLTWGWVLSRPHGTFNDQGGLALTLIVLPLTLGAWIVGGPIALALGGRALKSLGEGEASKDERRLARIGVWLSRVLLWAGVAWLFISMLTSFMA